VVLEMGSEKPIKQDVPLTRAMDDGGDAAPELSVVVRMECWLDIM
jgi:hypothetical protein